MLNVTIIKVEEENKLKERTMEPYNQYTVIFDDGCPAWTEDPKYNLMYLKHIECHANDMLRCRGWLVLNDIYDMLGVPRTKEGMTEGYVYVPESIIDFGLNDPKNYDFIEGIRNTAILTFNVDGDVRDLM